ncbi:MAG: hypothetical protein QXW70_03745 [Candidatus Anstonellales archaeon]
MNEKIIEIIKGVIRKWGGEPITHEKLVLLRNEVYKRTKTNKNAPFSNVKKWVKEARRQIRIEAKKSKLKEQAKTKGEADSAVSRIPESVQRSVDTIKEQTQEVYVERPVPRIVFDKVYLQNVQYEISGIRGALERISRQLDKLEKELSSHAED